MQRTTAPPLGSRPPAYEKLLARLARADWFCDGTVVCRTLRRKVAGQWVNKGPYYLWTAKRVGKTVCHALSRDQYHAAQQAIAAHRQIRAVLEKLQTMTLETILKKVPGVPKRK
ncbi:MAG: DUF6788 family protein [Limisphaerales bacterium]